MEWGVTTHRLTMMSVMAHPMRLHLAALPDCPCPTTHPSLNKHDACFTADADKDACYAPDIPNAYHTDVIRITNIIVYNCGTTTPGVHAKGLTTKQRWLRQPTSVGGLVTRGTPTCKKLIDVFSQAQTGLLSSDTCPQVNLNRSCSCCINPTQCSIPLRLKSQYLRPGPKTHYCNTEAHTHNTRRVLPIRNRQHPHPAQETCNAASKGSTLHVMTRGILTVAVCCAQSQLAGTSCHPRCRISCPP